MTTMPPEVPLTDLTGDQLRVRVARAQVYLIHAEEGFGSSPPQAVRRDHLAYLHRLQSHGLLYGYGPVEASAGDRRRELAIVAAASREHAEAIAGADPLHRENFRVNRVQGHTINEGVACYVGRAMARRAEAAEPAFDADVSGDKPTYGELAERARDAQLYLISLDPTDKVRSPEDTATFDAHFVWLRDNEMAARLMSCGPVEPHQPLPQGVWGGGLGIMATSREEAEAVAAREPSGVAGYRKLSVRGWTMQYGIAAPIAEALVALNALGA